MWVQSLGQEDPLEQGMATHSSILAWRISWTKQPGELQSIGSQRVGHSWSDLVHACACVRTHTHTHSHTHTNTHICLHNEFHWRKLSRTLKNVGIKTLKECLNFWPESRILNRGLVGGLNSETIQPIYRSIRLQVAFFVWTIWILSRGVVRNSYWQNVKRKCRLKRTVAENRHISGLNGKLSALQSTVLQHLRKK